MTPHSKFGTWTGRAILLVGAVAVAFLVALALILLGGGLGDRESVTETHSPNGVHHAAVVLDSEEPAWTIRRRYFTRVLVNTDREPLHTVFEVKGRRDVKITWRSNDELVITCGDCAPSDGVQYTPAWQSIRISFEFTD